MFGSHKDSADTGGQHTKLIAAFADENRARRALVVLKEHGFTSDQVSADFRSSVAETPAPARVEESRANGQGFSAGGGWFKDLRQIYRGAPTAATTTLEDVPVTQPASAADFSTTHSDNPAEPAAVVTVNAGARNQEAQALLESEGATILPNATDQTPTQATGIAVHSTPFHAPAVNVAPDHVQLFGENLRVHKEKVATGEVRVHKETTTRMETVQVPVTTEHLVVEHAASTDPASAGNAIRVPLSEERVSVEKETVLREEYKVGKRDVTQNETVAGTVRQERLVVDELGDDVGESRER